MKRIDLCAACINQGHEERDKMNGKTRHELYVEAGIGAHHWHEKKRGTEYAIITMATIQTTIKRLIGPGRYRVECASKHDGQGGYTFDAREFDAGEHLGPSKLASKMLAKWRRKPPALGFELALVISRKMTRDDPRRFVRDQYEMLDPGWDLRALKDGVALTNNGRILAKARA